MITCLGFVFFGRRRSKERGRYFRNFFGKIDEIQKSSIFTKPTLAHLKAYLMSFLIKQSNQSNVYFFLILPQLLPLIWGAKFLAHFNLHTPHTPPTFFIGKSQTLFFLIEHRKLYKMNP